MVDHFSELYGAYSEGLRAAKRVAMHCNGKGLSGDIEMEVIITSRGILSKYLQLA